MEMNLATLITRLKSRARLFVPSRSFVRPDEIVPITVIRMLVTSASIQSSSERLHQLSTSCRLILQLSVDENAEREECLTLIRKATVTILKDNEALQLTGQRRLPGVIECLQKLKAGNVVIFTPEGAHAWLDGNYYIVPSFPLESLRTIEGADDAFTNQFAHAMKNQLRWHACLRSSLKSMSEHMAGESI